jgi:hypothetical protein
VPLYTATRFTRQTHAAGIGGSNHNETVVVRDGANLSGTNHNETVVVRRSSASAR